MRHIRHVVASALLVPATLSAQTATSNPDRLRSHHASIAVAVDSIVTAARASGPVAGLTVAVVHGRQTLVLKGYGLADVELNVMTPDRAVYEIGSVTKQFTAAAILQLAEQGKLSLDDELATYVPHFRAEGHHVTLRRLLDHTSGIKGYTEIAEFGGLRMRTLSRDTIVALVGAQPFDFAPGEAMRYNNSAYFFLGLVIERVSGVSYETYVQQHLFAPAGMRDSRYCSNSALVPRRAIGYDVANGQLRMAEYLDQTWPYAAGSLCATAGDLVAWTQALHSGRILGPVAYRELLSPGVLTDGTRLRYASGVAVGDSLLGHRAIYHDGAIPGFSSALVYLPDESLTIAVLMNTLGPVRPLAIATSIIRALLGDHSPTGIAFHGSGEDYGGKYRGIGRSGEPMILTVRAADGSLTLQQDTGPVRRLTYLGGDTFGRVSDRYTFMRDGPQVTRLRVDDVFTDWIAVRQSATTNAPNAEMKDVALSDAERQPFVGSYSVTAAPDKPPMPLRVFVRGDTLMGQLRNNDPTRLIYQGDNIFRPAAAPEFSITFTVEHGEAMQLSIVSPDGTMRGVRIDAAHATPIKQTAPP
jgi:CubicO group peptidase (beta-lactamase class C family)